jgi:hypothetical protein
MTTDAVEIKHPAAVVDGEIKHLSVSAITKFDALQFAGCARKWWFRYVKRLPEPDQGYFADGTAMHAEIEHYLRSGEDVLGPLARAGKYLLPEPGEDLMLEADVGKLLKADGIPLVGRLDCAHRRGWYVDGEGVQRPDPHETIEVLDWKSTSDLRYAKSGAELINLVQMIGYAEYARLAFPTLENVRLSQVFFQKKKFKAQKATALFSLATVRQRWQSVEATVKHMRDVAKCEDVAQVPANYASCDAYRGCCYRAVCPKSRDQKLFEIFGGKSMNLLDRLNQQTNPNAAKPAPVPEPAKPAAQLPTSTPVKAPSAPSLSGLLGLASRSIAATATAAATKTPSTSSEEIIKQLEAEEAAHKSNEAPVTCPCGESYKAAYFDAHKKTCKAARAIDAFGGPKIPLFLGDCTVCGDIIDENNGSKTPSGRVVHTAGCKGASPVLPPDAARSEGAASAAPIPVGTVLPAPLAIAAEALGLAPKAPDAGTVADVPKKRGRPAKAKPVEPRTFGPGVSAPNTVEVNRDDLAQLKSAGDDDLDAVIADGFTLFIDVRVEGCTVRSLDSYVAQLCKVLADEYKAIDVRCAPKDSPLAFGGWKGALAGLAAAQPPAPGVYVLNDVRESELKQVVVEALKPLASLFVRGI